MIGLLITFAVVAILYAASFVVSHVLAMRVLADPPKPIRDRAGRAVYQPKPGYTWNPLLKHRNMSCLCGSGEKVKRCCGQFRAVPRELAEKLDAALKERRL